MSVTAPTTEIGYVQAPNYNWWLYDNETTPELVWPQSIYVYDQMRRQDSQVYSVLRAVTETLLRTPWRIDPAGARARVVKFVADDLGLPVVGKPTAPPPRLKDRFSWTSHLREALLMLPFGHSYFEQIYRVTPDGNAAHLRKLAYRPAKTIERIDVAADGGLISIKQYWTQVDREPKPITVDRLVAYIHAREGGNWLGTSILRPAYKNWLLKDRLLRLQAQTIERNGMGIPLYMAQEGASADDLTAGKNMATAWRAGEAAGSAVPFGADLVLRGVEGTLPDAEPAIRYHDEQIARAVLAHFLNLGTQTGSWALGTTFADFFTMSLQTLAEQIRDTATQHIVEDLVDINFGEDEPAPRLVFDEIGSRQAATAQALKLLVDAGVIRPDEVLEESSRQQYGLPPADAATVRQPPQPAAPADGGPAQPPQMGDLSVAAAMGDPKGEAAEAADLDDEADDWEDAIDALIVALRELDGYVEAAWDPAKHARNPKGSPGGGKFRSMVDRLKEAITQHGEGDGKGHPFDGFDREQLRRVAKARGIELKRGESRDSIAEKLLGHLGAPAKPGKPERKSHTRKTTSTGKLQPHVGGENLRNLDAQVRIAKKDLAPGQLKAVEQWTSGKGMVRKVQTGQVSEDTARNFDEAMQGLPKVDGLVYRAVSSRGESSQFAANLTPGQVLDLGAPVSTSIDPRQSGAFGTNLYEIESPSASYVAGVGSKFGYEKEAVLPPGRYEVVSTEYATIGLGKQDAKILVVRLRDVTEGDRSWRPTTGTDFQLVGAGQGAVAAKFNPAEPRDPHSGKWVGHGGGVAHEVGHLAHALGGQDALDVAPAKLTRAPNGHFGDYEGEKLSGPRGMGSVRALSEYEGPEYQTTNTFLRGGYRDPDTGKAATGNEDYLEGVHERIAEIDKTMKVSRLTSNVKVDRAIRRGSDVFGRDVWYGGVIDWNNDDMDAFDLTIERWEAGDRPDLTGLRWTDKGFVSTTADPKVAPKFGSRWVRLNSALDGEPVIMTIHVPKGTGGVQLSEMGHAAEILLERGLTYEVVADHGVDGDGFRRLDVAVVPNG